MTSEETTFNDFEKAILEWFVTTYNDDNLTAQIRSARLIKRNYNSAGFYLDIELGESAPMLSVESLLKINNKKYKWPISGPTFGETEDIEHGGGALMWGEDGYIDCIEIYSITGIKEHVKNFKFISQI